MGCGTNVDTKLPDVMRPTRGGVFLKTEPYSCLTLTHHLVSMCERPSSDPPHAWAKSTKCLPV